MLRTRVSPFLISLISAAIRVCRAFYPLASSAFRRNRAVLELNYSVTQMIVPVVVTDNNDGLAAGLELRQQTFVKDLAIMGILVCGPLIKDVDRTVL